MGVFFSKKKTTSRVTDQDKAVLQLKQTRDKLKQYQKRIEQNIEKDRDIARKLLQKNQKDRALLLLRKKKFQEQILVKADGQLENLERMVHDLEYTQIETKIIDGLKVGNEALKKLHDILSIDEIEKVMDETREGLEKQQEIDALLSGTLSIEDEGEVEAELDALIAKEAEDVKEETPEVPAEDVPLPDVAEDVPLPDVPEDEPVKEKAPKSKSKEPVALEA